MNEIEKEITRLTDIWYRFVSQDHHKDRDCHWYVEKYYSYGEEPYYKAYHHGYVANSFEGTKCTTLEEAEEELLNTIKFEIHKAKIWINRNLEEVKQIKPDDEYYFMGSVEEYESWLKVLGEA